MSKRNGNAGLKALAAIMAVLFVMLAVAGVVAYFSDWFTNWDKFKIKQEELMEEKADGGMLIGESEGKGVSLLSEKIAKADYAVYGVSPLAESAYTLTATITPSYAVNKSVDWSVEFVTPSSSWATGKTVTDYVTVTPTSDGALTANVECKQAFGAQMKITVVSRENSAAKAECTIDYAKRVTKATLTSSNSRYNWTINGSGSLSVCSIVHPQVWLDFYGALGGDNKSVNEIAYAYNTVYTVDNTVKNSVVEIKVSDSLKQNLASAGLTTKCADWTKFTELGYSNTEFSYAGVFVMLGGDSLLGGGYLQLDNYNKLLSAIVSTEGVDFSIRITTEMQYGGSVSTVLDCRFDDASTGMVAEGVTLGDSNLVF